MFNFTLNLYDWFGDRKNNVGANVKNNIKKGILPLGRWSKLKATIILESNKNQGFDKKEIFSKQMGLNWIVKPGEQLMFEVIIAFLHYLLFTKV